MAFKEGSHRGSFAKGFIQAFLQARRLQMQEEFFEARAQQIRNENARADIELKMQGYDQSTGKFYDPQTGDYTSSVWKGPSYTKPNTDAPSFSEGSGTVPPGASRGPGNVYQNNESYKGGGGGTTPNDVAAAEAAKSIPAETMSFLQARGSRGLNYNLDPQFAPGLHGALAEAEAATGERARIADLRRTEGQQAADYARYQRGEISLAAAPGQGARHEHGDAGDIAQGKVLSWLHAHPEVMAKYGVEFLPGRAGQIDPGHIQKVGAPTGKFTQNEPFTPYKVAGPWEPVPQANLRGPMGGLDPNLAPVSPVPRPGGVHMAPTPQITPPEEDMDYWRQRAGAVHSGGDEPPAGQPSPNAPRGAPLPSGPLVPNTPLSRPGIPPSSGLAQYQPSNFEPPYPTPNVQPTAPPPGGLARFQPSNFEPPYPPPNVQPRPPYRPEDDPRATIARPPYRPEDDPRVSPVARAPAPATAVRPNVVAPAAQPVAATRAIPAAPAMDPRFTMLGRPNMDPTMRGSPRASVPQVTALDLSQFFNRNRAAQAANTPQSGNPNTIISTQSPTAGQAIDAPMPVPRPKIADNSPPPPDARPQAGLSAPQYKPQPEVAPDLVPNSTPEPAQRMMTRAIPSGPGQTVASNDKNQDFDDYMMMNMGNEDAAMTELSYRGGPVGYARGGMVRPTRRFQTGGSTWTPNTVAAPSQSLDPLTSDAWYTGITPTRQQIMDERNMLLYGSTTPPPLVQMGMYTAAGLQALQNQNLTPDQQKWMALSSQALTNTAPHPYTGGYTQTGGGRSGVSYSPTVGGGGGYSGGASPTALNDVIYNQIAPTTTQPVAAPPPPAPTPPPTPPPVATPKPAQPVSTTTDTPNQNNIATVLAPNTTQTGNSFKGNAPASSQGTNYFGPNYNTAAFNQTKLPGAATPTTNLLDDGGGVSPSAFGLPPGLGGQGQQVPPVYYNPQIYSGAGAPVGRGPSQNTIPTFAAMAVPTYAARKGGAIPPRPFGLSRTMKRYAGGGGVSGDDMEDPEGEAMTSDMMFQDQMGGRGRSMPSPMLEAPTAPLQVPDENVYVPDTPQSDAQPSPGGQEVAFRTPSTDFRVPGDGGGMGGPRMSVGSGGGGRTHVGVPRVSSGKTSPDVAPPGAELEDYDTTPQQPLPKGMDKAYNHINEPPITPNGDLSQGMKGLLQSGLDFIFGQTQPGSKVPPDAATAQARRDFVTHTPDEDHPAVQALHQHLDPSATMDKALNNINGMWTVAKHHMLNGDPQGAARWMASMYMYSQSMAAMHGEEAVKRYWNGDVQGALNNLAEAYKYVPDAQRVQATANPDGSANVELTNAKGVLRWQGRVAPQEILAAAVGTQNKSWFWHMAQNAAADTGNLEARADIAQDRAEEGESAIAATGANEPLRSEEEKGGGGGPPARAIPISGETPTPESEAPTPATFHPGLPPQPTGNPLVDQVNQPSQEALGTSPTTKPVTGPRVDSTLPAPLAQDVAFDRADTQQRADEQSYTQRINAKYFTPQGIIYNGQHYVRPVAPNVSRLTAAQAKQALSDWKASQLDPYNAMVAQNKYDADRELREAGAASREKFSLLKGRMTAQDTEERRAKNVQAQADRDYTHAQNLANAKAHAEEVAARNLALAPKGDDELAKHFDPTQYAGSAKTPEDWYNSSVYSRTGSGAKNFKDEFKSLNQQSVMGNALIAADKYTHDYDPATKADILSGIANSSYGIKWEAIPEDYQNRFLVTGIRPSDNTMVTLILPKEQLKGILDVRGQLGGQKLEEYSQPGIHHAIPPEGRTPAEPPPAYYFNP